MAMYATNRFAGDGVTTSYEFNFVGGYLDRAHVKAYVEDANLVRTPVTLSPGNFIGPYTIGGIAPVPVGATLVIYRDTPKAPLVNFVNGSRLTEYNLDTATRQGSFIAAEGADAVSPSGLEGVIRQVDDFSGAAGVARDQAVAAKDTAEASANAARLSEINANGSALSAATDAAVALNNKNLSDTAAFNAAISKTGADSARDAAVIAKNAAEAALDSFDDRYLGAKASAPATDNDGGALLTGALYWDTSLPGMRSWNGGAWVTLPAATKASVGLPNVDDTSDADKPISSATQTALDGKANTSHTHAIADVTGLQAALDGTVKTTGDQTIGGYKTFSGTLAVSGTRIFQTASSIGFALGPGVGTGDTNIQGFSVGAGKTLMFMANAGAGWMRLDGSGNLTASGNVTAYSDIRLKTDLTKITDALSKVSRLSGYTYTRKDTGSRQTGVIAQEVQEVLPEAVMDNGGHLSVAYGNIVGLLIEAIKELKSEVDQLKGK